MTKSELEQYKKDRRQILRLKDRLKDDCRTFDTVKGSMPEAPYIERTIILTGIDRVAAAEIQQEITDLERHCDVVKAFIETVPDAELRSIMEFRYIYGYSWPKVMRKMHCTISTDAMRKRVERYFEKSF